MNIPCVLLFAVKIGGSRLTIERGNYRGIPFWENPTDMSLAECARRAIEPNATIIDLGEPAHVCKYTGEWKGVVSRIELHYFDNAIVYPHTTVCVGVPKIAQ